MKDKMTVLVVDDDIQLIRLVRTNLESVGYRVIIASDGQTALQELGTQQADVIILDIMLPDMDGYEVCQRIREFSAVPIIMLTAKVEDLDKVKGLKLGADDYIGKPFSVQELLARVEAVLRRTGSAQVGQTMRIFTCGDITLDFIRRIVKVRGQEVSLTLTEYKLLTCLASNAGRVMLHRDLLTTVWGAEYQDEREYLRAYIRHLRQKIEDDQRHPSYILSKPGMGYMFRNPAETV